MERLRMCISCREMKDKKELLRIVKNKEGEILVDKTGKQNGRGAYICRKPECFEKLKKQKILNKAFKMNVDESVYSLLEDEILGETRKN